MVVFCESADPFPSFSFPDLREVLRRGSKGAVLETHELRDLSVVLGLTFDVVRYLGRYRESAPVLWESVRVCVSPWPKLPLPMMTAGLSEIEGFSGGGGGASWA